LIGLGTDDAAADAETIFRAGLARVDPIAMVREAVRVEGPTPGTLVVESGPDSCRCDLGGFDTILVAGMGKAGSSMARGLEDALGDRIAGGLVAVKDGYLEELSRIRLIQSGHPVPDGRSEAAAREILAMASGGPGGRGLDERTLIIVLISGGGSALLCAPAPGLSLEDKAETTRLLLASGATIQEINCVRKHLSAVKGGRLAQAFAPATVISLILSDVIGDDLDAIASGPTVPDSTTWADALAVIERRGLASSAPAAAIELLRRGAAGELPDTPKLGDPAFSRARSVLLGSNALALMAAEEKARELGYSTLALTSRLSGEAREAALALHAIGEDIAASGFPLRRPACVLAGGETTVTLRGGGKGGRNQEMALAFLAATARSPRASENLVFLAASTDGSDGPTDAAGAFASAPILSRARELGLDPEAYLADNDSYSFFDRAGGLLRTGPTNTNVCDLQVMIIP
jgi:hydroxypyruvate reductase